MKKLDIPNNIYGFSLSGLSSKLLWQLKPLDMCYQIWPNNIARYLDILIHDQPKCILGIGVYSGIDRDSIRIETITTNKFRNDVIDKKFPISKKLEIKPFVKQIPHTKFASALGNSWCNLISWKIMRLIEDKKLHSQYSFLHIPSYFGFKNALETIEAMLN